MATFFVDCLKVLYCPRRESTEENKQKPNREAAERVKFTWRYFAIGNAYVGYNRTAAFQPLNFAIGLSV
jgi:hypothetical protein